MAWNDEWRGGYDQWSGRMLKPERWDLRYLLGSNLLHLVTDYRVLDFSLPSFVYSEMETCVSILFRKEGCACCETQLPVFKTVLSGYKLLPLFRRLK